MTQKRRAVRSKTIQWSGLLILLSLWPAGSRWVAEHASETLALIGVVNILLRYFTRYQLEVPALPGRRAKALLFALGASISLLWVGTACAMAKGRVRADLIAQQPILAGDATGLIDCGAGQPLVGFCYLRVIEGDSAGRSVWFIGPPAECSREDSCVFIKVWNNQGALVWGGSIPKGRTRVEVPWKTLLGADRFEVGHRGFWTFNHEVIWKNAEGREQVSVSQGDLLVRVYRQGYQPLDKVDADPNFVWTWIDGPWRYRVTSALRAFVGRAEQ